jgi:hypothetical protein
MATAVASSSAAAGAAADPKDNSAKAPAAPADGAVAADGAAKPDDKPSEPLRGAVIGKGGGLVLTMGQILAGVSAFNFLLAALFLLWWDPHLYLLGGAVASGLGFGVLVTFLYYKNLRRKEELQELVRVWVVRLFAAFWARARERLCFFSARARNGQNRRRFTLTHPPASPLPPPPLQTQTKNSSPWTQDSKDAPSS